jgi:hypothetical protein
MDYGVYYTLTYENENATVRVKGLWGGSRIKIIPRETILMIQASKKVIATICFSVHMIDRDKQI